MKEEKYITDMVGNQNPFRVPEGYFDGLTEQVMWSLPERRQRAKSVWMRPVFYVAASVCALLISGAAYLFLSGVGQQDSLQAQVPAMQESSDVSFDEAADYMMLDNQDIYACLAGF